MKWLDELDTIQTAYSLPSDAVCLVGGSAFALHGLRDNTDIDLAVLPDVFQAALISSGKIAHLKTVRNIIQLSKHVDIHIERFHNLGLSDKELITDCRYHTWSEGRRVCRLEVEFVDKLCFRPELDIHPAKYGHRHRRCGGSQVV